MHELSRGAGWGDLRVIADLTIEDRNSPVMLRKFVIGQPGGETAHRMVQWEFDRDVSRYYYANETYRPQTAEEVYTLYKNAGRNHAIAAYEILYNQTPVGFASLRDTGLPARQALMGFMVGDTRMWGKHIVTKAVAMLLMFARHTDLRTVRAKIYHENIAAVRVAERYATGRSMDSEKIYHYFDFNLASLSVAVLNGSIDPIIRQGALRTY